MKLSKFEISRDKSSFGDLGLVLVPVHLEI
jgi:hypothetical protein